MDYDHARTDISQGNMKGWWGKGQGGKGLKSRAGWDKVVGGQTRRQGFFLKQQEEFSGFRFLWVCLEKG